MKHEQRLHSNTKHDKRLHSPAEEHIMVCNWLGGICIYLVTKTVQGSTSVVDRNSQSLEKESAIYMYLHLSHNMTTPKTWHVHPAKIRISLGIRRVISPRCPYDKTKKNDMCALQRLRSSCPYEETLGPRKPVGMARLVKRDKLDTCIKRI